MRFVLGAIAAVVLAGTAFVQPAEARCFWNGFAMECYHSNPYWMHRQHVYRDFDRFDRPAFVYRERNWY
jgi:hypothetical protein